MPDLSYAAITAARNEEACIERTIRSMLAQTARPVKWTIVSDGSTDRTDEIVETYARSNDWIELVRRAGKRAAGFSAKVNCLLVGLERLRDVECDVVCNLDADVEFKPDVYEILLSRLADDPRLGIVGPLMREEGYDPVQESLFSEEDPFGAFMIFRRACFEEIGGYRPLPSGGEDWLAVRMARFKGWRTRIYDDVFFDHLRPMGSGEGSVLATRFKYGCRDYVFGNHPLWELGRTIFQMKRRPYAIGGVLLFAGYAWSWIRRVPRPVPAEIVRLHRKEEMARIRGFFRGLARRRR
ncbi:glycosyltransferase [Candidatus Sumerlaeota bacterium]|nr:glycosyltransferase [Candidatus Sumerlaeota bacterium]